MLENTMKNKYIKLKELKEKEKELNVLVENALRTYNKLIIDLRGVNKAIKVLEEAVKVAELKEFLEVNELEPWKYTATTDYIGMDTVEYFLTPKDTDVYVKYEEEFNNMALENLHYYGYVTEEEKWDDDTGEYDDFAISDYDYSVEKITDMSELMDIDIGKLEIWD